MKDLRKRGGVPFGYRIENGKAVVNEEEAEKLREFFKLFLAGSSMAAAARDAGLSCHHTTLPFLMKRKAYIGTVFYPEIISAEYQEKLISEWEKRKGEGPRTPYVRAVRFVKINTEFDAPESEPPHTTPESYIMALYEQIRPVETTT